MSARRENSTLHLKPKGILSSSACTHRRFLGAAIGQSHHNRRRFLSCFLTPEIEPEFTQKTDFYRLCYLFSQTKPRLQSIQSFSSREFACRVAAAVFIYICIYSFPTSALGAAVLPNHRPKEKRMTVLWRGVIEND